MMHHLESHFPGASTEECSNMSGPLREFPLDVIGLSLP